MPDKKEPVDWMAKIKSELLDLILQADLDGRQYYKKQAEAELYERIAQARCDLIDIGKAWEAKKSFEAVLLDDECENVANLLDLMIDANLDSEDAHYDQATEAKAEEAWRKLTQFVKGRRLIRSLDGSAQRSEVPSVAADKDTLYPPPGMPGGNPQDVRLVVSRKEAETLQDLIDWTVSYGVGSTQFDDADEIARLKSIKERLEGEWR